MENMQIKVLVISGKNKGKVHGVLCSLGSTFSKKTQEDSILGERENQRMVGNKAESKSRR